MTGHLTDPDGRRLRFRANWLHRPDGPKGPAGVLEVVRHIGGVQAQSWFGASLAVRARSRSTTQGDVDAARVHERAVLRGWFMRGTLHLVPTADAGWLLQLLGPVMIAATARRYRELGLDEDVSRRAVNTIERALLADGPLARQEIGERLLAAGLPIETAGQQVIHLIRRAGLEGRVCYGPDRGRVETWVATRDWLGRGPELADDAENAAADLARRYLRGHGPATAGDFASWSGLPLSAARSAFNQLRGELTEVRFGETAAATLGPMPKFPPAREELRLLGEFDPYLLGYQSRSFAVDDRFARAVHPGGGMLRPTIVRDGWAVGTWTLDRRRRPPTITARPFDAGDRLDTAAEAADIARFLAG